MIRTIRTDFVEASVSERAENEHSTETATGDRIDDLARFVVMYYTVLVGVGSVVVLPLLVGAYLSKTANVPVIFGYALGWCGLFAVSCLLTRMKRRGVVAVMAASFRFVGESLAHAIRRLVRSSRPWPIARNGR